MSATNPMVIIGAGQCGARAAHALRENGWEGAITLLGDEGRAPYERPPLSKSVLLGQKAAAQCAIYDEAFYRSQCIDLRVDAPAIGIDPDANKVLLADGHALAYDRVLIATGAQPRQLDVPGAMLAGVHVLRDASDAYAVAGELAAGCRIVVIGAGFIGLEVAAAAVERNCKVIVLEAAPRALMRAVPEAVASHLVEQHRQHGVDMRFGAKVRRITGVIRATGVELADGTTVACDAVVVGIGVIPRTALAATAGIEIADGVAVDETLRTTDPRIFAAGDACSFPHPLFERRIRLECWKNAEDQASVVARNMLGGNEIHSAVPWFWSDQYGLTIQIAGLPTLGTTEVARDTGPASRVFFALDSEGVLVGASGVGELSDISREVRIAQELIARRARVEPWRLADRATKLRSLLVAEVL